MWMRRLTANTRARQRWMRPLRANTRARQRAGHPARVSAAVGHDVWTHARRGPTETKEKRRKAPPAGVSLGEGASQSFRKRHLVPFGEFIPPGFRWVLAIFKIPLTDFARGDAGQPPLPPAGIPIPVTVCSEGTLGAELSWQPFRPDLDRHIAQRNVHVTQTAAAMILTLNNPFRTPGLTRDAAPPTPLDGVALRVLPEPVPLPDSLSPRGLLWGGRGGGCWFVNVTSIAGSRVHPFAGAAYATSK